MNRRGLLKFTATFLIFMAVAFSVATASADSLTLHIASKHGGGCDTCNEENWGIGWRGDGRLAPTAGYYTNSWFRDSFYFGANYHLGGGWSVSGLLVSGYVGAVDSKYLIGGEFLPVPLLSYRWLDTAVSPVLSFAPTQDRGVTLLSIDWRW